MSPLSAFGLFSVTLMLVCYAMEKRSPWFILAFASPARSAQRMDSFREPGPSDWWRPCGRWWHFPAGGRNASPSSAP